MFLHIIYLYFYVEENFDILKILIDKNIKSIDDIIEHYNKNTKFLDNITILNTNINIDELKIVKSKLAANNGKSELIYELIKDKHKIFKDINIPIKILQNVDIPYLTKKYYKKIKKLK